jgi:plasmid stability protein
MHEEFMATLQVRDFPDDLHKRLAELADQEHRSLAQQVTVLLMQALEHTESNVRRRAQILDLVQADQDAKIGKKAAEPVKLIREDRDR